MITAVAARQLKMSKSKAPVTALFAAELTKGFPAPQAEGKAEFGSCNSQDSAFPGLSL